MNKLRPLLLAVCLALPLPALAHNGVDHNAHHGGILRTVPDMHFEVALSGGMLQIYFSSPSGEQLPASAISQVDVEIAPASGKTQYLSMAIDPTGVFWMGKPQPLDGKNVIRVGFVRGGKSALLDVPAEPVLAAEAAAKRIAAAKAQGAAKTASSKDGH